MLLKDRLTLISGAAQGNGKAIAEGFAEQGALVIVADINEDKAESVAEEIRMKGGKAWTCALDVSDREQCQEQAQRIKSEIGHLAVLVNNAGIYVRNKIDSPDLFDAWDRAINTNLTSMLNVSEPFLDSLRQTQGSIINISSIAGFRSTKTSIAYSTSKAGIVMFTKELANEMAKDNVRVNAIAPGSFVTSMTAQTRSEPERYENFLKRIPMGRFGEPEELVGPAVFLAANSMSSYVTGETLFVDGGYMTG
jgi:NAD(P)-dependent dehydrogenase (short-subunit alcohol dehydrogenase family)